ncbi:MAG: hypothetical protein FJW94_07965 [Actinobacteria bacterium]|nr:hypothetical protein [Actinomycetota bacterium]
MDASSGVLVPESGDDVRLQPWHRFGRLVATRRSSRPSDADLQWASRYLSAAEETLLSTMTGDDQAHVIRVARRVDASVAVSDPLLGPERRWMIAAALMHDVGKAEAPLGPLGRSAVTVIVWLGGGRVARRYVDRSGRLGRAARYATYPELGASLLTQAGSDARVAAWSREHHLPMSSWSIPPPAGEVLSRADDLG